jgi:hypothetical protein
MSTYRRNARAIAQKLIALGVIKKDDPDPKGKVYYLARKRKIKVGRWGKDLLTTDEQLERDLAKLVS